MKEPIEFNFPCAMNDGRDSKRPVSFFDGHAKVVLGPEDPLFLECLLYFRPAFHQVINRGVSVERIAEKFFTDAATIQFILDTKGPSEVESIRLDSESERVLFTVPYLVKGIHWHFTEEYPINYPIPKEQQQI